MFSVNVAGLTNFHALSFGDFWEIKRHINTCAYTGITLPEKEKSFEHIRPRSQGGPDSAANGLVVSKKKNHARGAMALTKFFNRNPGVEENVCRYLKSPPVRDLVIDGIDYDEAARATIEGELGRPLAFMGNKLSLIA